MINRFKFLTDNDEEELEYGGFVNDFDYGLASWMWTNPEMIQGDPHWEQDEMLVTGIRSFLSNFPEQMIVPVLSITGNNITMTIDNENDGWPYDILGGTLLHIVYLKWVP